MDDQQLGHQLNGHGVPLAVLKPKASEHQEIAQLVP
jgi:hypothetical protein